MSASNVYTTIAALVLMAGVTSGCNGITKPIQQVADATGLVKSEKTGSINYKPRSPLIIAGTTRLPKPGEDKKISGWPGANKSSDRGKNPANTEIANPDLAAAKAAAKAASRKGTKVANTDFQEFGKNNKLSPSELRRQHEAFKAKFYPNIKGGVSTKRRSMIEPPVELWAIGADRKPDNKAVQKNK